MTKDASSDQDDKKLTTVGVFSRAASTYDHVGPRFFTYYGHRLVELAQITQGSSVLDIATGRGASLFPAVDRIGPSGWAVGIDLAEEMIKELGHDIRTHGILNVDARVMDAEDLSFPDATFDYVLCGFCLFFFPHLGQALSEILRVLKPNGRLASSTWGKTSDQWQWLDQLFEKYLPEATPPPENTVAPGPDFETPGGMETLMQEASFARIATVAESRTFTYASEEEWWGTQWSHGARAGLEEIDTRLGREGLARFRLEAFDTIRGLKTPTGIHQSFPVLFTLASKP
jgi:ubiquinone/menaquinone biosynthesis C-methylase UbiE